MAEQSAAEKDLLLLDKVLFRLVSQPLQIIPNDPDYRQTLRLTVP